MTGSTSSALGNQVILLLVAYIMGYIIGMSQQNRKSARQQSSEPLRVLKCCIKYDFMAGNAITRFTQNEQK